MGQESLREHSHNKEVYSHALDIHISRLLSAKARSKARSKARCDCGHHPLINDAAREGSFSTHGPTSSSNIVNINFKHKEEGNGSCLFHKCTT